MVLRVSTHQPAPLYVDATVALLRQQLCELRAALLQAPAVRAVDDVDQGLAVEQIEIYGVFLGGYLMISHDIIQNSRWDPLIEDPEIQIDIYIYISNIGLV